MPQLDRELTAKGMLPFLPATVQEAAMRRDPGFFPEFVTNATLSKGAFYLDKEKFEELKEKYPSRAPTPKPPAPPTAEVSEFDSSVEAFLDLDQDNPHPEWGPAREAYREELTKALEEECTPCTINSIKRKFKVALLQIPYGN